MPKRSYPRWQRKHDQVLKWCFEHPGGNQSECSEATGYSPTHISRIQRSPDFRMRYREVADAQLGEIWRRRFMGEKV